MPGRNFAISYTNVLLNKYRMFLLSFLRALQLYRKESLHPPGHLATSALLRAPTKEAPCFY